MILSSFVTSAIELYFLHEMAAGREEHRLQGLRRNEGKNSAGRGKLLEGKNSAGRGKLLEIALCLAYIVYGTATTEPLGPGTTALIVVACLAEVLLLCFEGYTVCKYDAKVLPE
jgi:hypothetical protein